MLVKNLIQTEVLKAEEQMYILERIVTSELTLMEILCGIQDDTVTKPKA